MAKCAKAAKTEATAKGAVREDLLKQIDKVGLGSHLTLWKEIRKTAPWKVSVDRDRLCMESWKETEGEDIEIRRAKLFEKVLLNMPISILDCDLVAGRKTEHFWGACSAMDTSGNNIWGLFDEEDHLSLGVVTKGEITREDREVMRECARYFDGKTAPDYGRKAWKALVGSWAEDMEQTFGKDPGLQSGFFPGMVSKPMWEKILTMGLAGFIKEAEEKLERLKENNETDMDKFYFYQSVIIVCNAAIAYARRYAKLAEEMAKKEKNTQRKKELEDIAKICKRVPEHPARTFYEAVQSINLVGVAKSLEHPFSFFPMVARLDQYLYPYFRKDVIEDRTLSVQMASDLIANFIGHVGSEIFIANEFHRKSHQTSVGINNISVGGVNRNGEPADNELSYLILHAVGLLKLSAPTICFRWHPNTPLWFLEKGISTNLLTRGGLPLFENCRHVEECYVADGTPAEHARDWYGLGCVTPLIPDVVEHYGSEGTGAFNVPFILDMTLHNGKSAVTGKKVGLETGDPREFKTFEEVYQAFQKQEKFIVHRILWLAGVAREVGRNYCRLPFLSTILAPGCMETGKDVMVPDPSFHTFCISDRGIIDTADSLIAIKKLVFDDKILTMAELMDAIDANFEGPRGEEIRQMCLAAPKFGNDIDEADWMVREVGRYSASVIHSFDNSPYPRYKLSREGLSWHYLGGLGVGALANGRKAKEPLNDGSISPMRGMDKQGPTGVLRSVLKAGFNESYATALNQKFSMSTMKSPESQKKLAMLTDTFLRNGGQHIQYNLFDTAELLDAKKHPEKYQDLVVRVGGFSTYFVHLSPEIQDDVILRSTQGLV